MTTERQAAANRENAKKSTGPRTQSGKRRSRRNAVRHGLTAETVIDVFEDVADYEALAAAINADFRPATNFERQLMGRLTSLLWRLRRATAIESGLLALEAKREPSRAGPENKLEVFYKLSPLLEREPPNTCSAENVTTVAGSYLRLLFKNGKALERLRRYESSLWRQTVQLILLLNAVNRGSPTRETFGGSVNRALWPPFTPPL